MIGETKHIVNVKIVKSDSKQKYQADQFKPLFID